jgi:hypothetical protein
MSGCTCPHCVKRPGVPATPYDHLLACQNRLNVAVGMWVKNRRQGTRQLSQAYSEYMMAEWECQAWRSEP